MNTETFNPIAAMPISERIKDYGSVSSDTLKPEHLLKEFAYTYFDLMPAEYRFIGKMHWFVRSSIIFLHRCNGAEWDESDHELGTELVGEFIEFFNSLCPENFYFGAHQFDGADFGFWPMETNRNWANKQFSRF